MTGADPSGAALRSSPSAARNAAAIGSVLADWLSGCRGTLLEVGCGTGQHAAAISASLPGLTWLPTDAEVDSETVLGWRETANAPERIAAPAQLDVRDARRWRDVAGVTALVTINTLHIMDWSSVEALFEGSSQALREGGLLFVYGPMHVGGQPTGPGNEAFDRTLRQRKAGQGIRDLEAVRALAASCGLIERALYAMPADNRMLVWQKRRAAA